MLSKAAGLALALICASAHADILHAADTPGAQDGKLSKVTPTFVSDFFCHAARIGPFGLGAAATRLNAIWLHNPPRGISTGRDLSRQF